MNIAPTPPHWADRLLTWFCAPHRLEEVQGDLYERYDRDVQLAGVRTANWRYWLNVLRFVRPFAIKRQPNVYSSPSLNLDMLRNFVKIALRQLWHNRLFTGLNVVGLSVGLSACWIIYRLVSYEFAFDQHHPNKDRTYRVVTQFNKSGQESGFAGVPVPLLSAVRSQVAGIEQSVPIRGQWMDHVYASRRGQKPVRFRDVLNVVATTDAYFGLVQYQWLAGDPTQALAQPGQVVLTQSRAERYFPGLTARQTLGQTLTYQDTLRVRVTGVVTDPTRPSSFEGREFLSLATLPPPKDPTGQWDNLNADDQLFIRLLAKADAKKVETQINNLVALHSEAVREKKGIRERWHPLQPLNEVHFGTNYGDSRRRASMGVLYGLMGLAGFILLLAVINYVNLATAQAPARAREIGIRKTLGSRRRTLVLQFLGETGAVTILALALAFVLAQFFFAYFGDLLPVGADTYINWPLTIGFLIALVLIVSLLAGLYPSWLATRFQPVAVLRGQAHQITGQSSRGLTLRKGLIVFQFVMAQVFIVSAWLLGQQLRFALAKDMGFNRDAVVLAQLPYTNTDPATTVRQRWVLRQEIAGLPGVAAVSLGNPPANQSMRLDEMTLKQAKREVKVTLQYKYVDTNYVSLYKLPLLAGRNLLVTDTVRDYVLNETAVRALGFTRPQDAIGQFLHAGNGAFPIVGVVRDFQVTSVREKINPVALVAYQHYANQINVRLASNRPADWQVTLAKIGRIWPRFYPEEPFNYNFYDQTLATFYETERTMTRIINLATGVAILVSCLGLFGLATLTAFQRRKEIGVRKVLGASVAGVVALLSKDFIKLVLIAIVLASPLAWWGMSWFLQQYAYKIDIAWWVFALAGLLAIGIALLTVSFQSVKAALANPVTSLRSE